METYIIVILISSKTRTNTVVITPYVERYDERVGRVIMKYVFDQYLTRKGGTEYK